MTDLSEKVIQSGRRAFGWRWMGQDVVAERAFPVGGGLVATTAFVAAEVIGRRRCRRSLARLAEPRWRAVGALWVVTTDLRFAVLREGVWSSIWLGSASGVEELPDGLVLRFPAEPAYALRWVG